MAYCDTNIITAFINRPRLEKLGKYGYDKFKRSIRQENTFAEKKAISVNSCRISKDALVNDVGMHKPSVGAVLTFSGLKNLEIVDVDGMKKGRELYNKTCEKIPIESKFSEKFCNGKKLKLNNELRHNDLQDINHFGSAIEMNEDEFVTVNKQDFKAVKGYNNLRIKIR